MDWNLVAEYQIQSTYWQLSNAHRTDSFTVLSDLMWLIYKSSGVDGQFLCVLILAEA